MAGRISAFTPELGESIVLAVKAGAPLRVAAMANGIAESTLTDWLACGEGRPSRIQPDEPLREQLSAFSVEVRKAKGTAHLTAIGTIRSAVVGGNWQAALAWIRLRYPEHYAERIEHSGPGGGPIAFEIAQALEGLTEEELASIESHILASGSPAAVDPGGEGET